MVVGAWHILQHPWGETVKGTPQELLLAKWRWTWKCSLQASFSCASLPIRGVVLEAETLRGVGGCVPSQGLGCLLCSALTGTLCKGWTWEAGLPGIHHAECDLGWTRCIARKQAANLRRVCDIQVVMSRCGHGLTQVLKVLGDNALVSGPLGTLRVHKTAALCQSREVLLWQQPTSWSLMVY